MIAMLVRDYDCIEVFGIFTDGGQPAENLSLTQPGIDEDASATRRHKRCITGAAAGEDANLEHRVKTDFNA
jgi:hypothetical protein